MQAAILQQTADYITHLETNNKELRQENNDLKKVIMQQESTDGGYFFWREMAFLYFFLKRNVFKEEKHNLDLWNFFVFFSSTNVSLKKKNIVWTCENFVFEFFI